MLFGEFPLREAVGNVYYKGRGEALREPSPRVVGCRIHTISSWISVFVKLGSIETDILKGYPSAYTAYIGLQVATGHVM